MVKALGVSESIELEKESWIGSRKQKKNGRIPDKLESYLNDHAQLNGKDLGPKIGAILMTLTVEKKKKARHHPEELASIHWGFEKRILMPCIKNDRYIMSEGKIDYILWYGALTELETNFIVVKAKRLSSDHYWNLLQNMAKIHWARKYAMRKSTIYGLATDGAQWRFVHIDEKGQQTGKLLRWDDDSIQVIARINTIIDQAVSLAKHASRRRLHPRQGSVYKMTGCGIWDQVESEEK
ncbi:uncharacterized protein PFLUO_LOCUS5311 [Penicillium psychrofluorescens]|uniref:uncharacterized protein n=1 Tax=Penicillium psychrofluorescens TaxID=3158075 RepID=UPI003CCDA790